MKIAVEAFDHDEEGAREAFHVLRTEDLLGYWSRNASLLFDGSLYPIFS